MSKKTVPLFRVEFDDGSVFVMPSHLWQLAFEWKNGRKANDERAEAFKIIVDGYVSRRESPSEFGDEPWPIGSSFPKAQMAYEVMYSEVRAPLMSIVMSEMSKGTPKDAKASEKSSPKVIGINEDGTSVLYDWGTRVNDICPACCPCECCVRRPAEERKCVCGSDVEAK